MKASADFKNMAQSGGRESWLDAVREQVSSLKFGVVQIVVHGARVVQIERTEKVRLENSVALSESSE